MIGRMHRTMLVDQVAKTMLVAAFWTSFARSQSNPAPDREVIDGITTLRVIPGAPISSRASGSSSRTGTTSSRATSTGATPRERACT